jgi:hypothetical protein
MQSRDAFELDLFDEFHELGDLYVLDELDADAFNPKVRWGASKPCSRVEVSNDGRWCCCGTSASTARP